jgi:hypothetical protein
MIRRGSWSPSRNGATRLVSGVSGDDYTLRLVSAPAGNVYVNLYGDGQTIFSGAIRSASQTTGCC